MSHLARLGKFIVLTLRKSGRDGIALHSSALAFSTVFSIIPLLAAFLFVGGHVFQEYRPQVIGILKQILPYTEDRLLTQISDFLSQAEHLRGIGLAGFLVVALITFASIESTLNRIWNITAGRALRTRLYSFVMLLFWGPLLIGAAYSVLALLRQQTTFERLWQESLPVMAIPFLVTAFGLTMLYWAVPNTAVRFRSALLGGVTAALMIEGLRFGFKLYLRFAPNLSLVYGGFALALFFMISIDAAWLIVLLGSEISYTSQHFAAMSRRRRSIAPLEGGWLGLAVLWLIAEHEGAGQTAVPAETLASVLELPTNLLRDAIAPLLAAGLVSVAGRRGEGYRLERRPEEIDAEAVFAAYDGRQLQLLAALGGPASARFAEIQQRLLAARRAALGTETVRSANSSQSPSDASGA
ncbi:MAG: YhjD/YihY/BrkB family envelope integrity protein [Acidobacteriota bacterium]